jgi:acetyl-CoA carboxylase beta subunit
MELSTIGSIAMSMAFTYVLIKSPLEEDAEGFNKEFENEPEEENLRSVTLSCQTCRKLKKHREIQKNLFQCVKCKRHVDIR